MHRKAGPDLVDSLADALRDLSGPKTPVGDADVEQKQQAQSGEKPAAQLARFLEEPRKEGPFTTLQEDRPDGAGDRAFIGSWTRK